MGNPHRIRRCGAGRRAVAPAGTVARCRKCGSAAHHRKAKPTRRIVAAVRRGSIASPLIQESLDILQVNANRILTSRLDEDL